MGYGLQKWSFLHQGCLIEIHSSLEFSWCPFISVSFEVCPFLLGHLRFRSHGRDRWISPWTMWQTALSYGGSYLSWTLTWSSEADPARSILTSYTSARPNLNCGVLLGFANSACTRSDPISSVGRTKWWDRFSQPTQCRKIDHQLQWRVKWPANHRRPQAPPQPVCLYKTLTCPTNPD